MSGHNKWSTIKHKKAKTDQQKGKIFSKVVKEIMMAAKLGGSDPAMNARLRLAIQKAKEANMPNDNISRAVQKGSASGDESNLEEILFEIYAPFGVAMLVEAMTDNRNRTVPAIRAVLNKYDATLATKGAVSYQFSKKGQILFAPGSATEDQVIEIAANFDIEDVIAEEDGSIEVTMKPAVFEDVKKAFDDQKLVYASAEVAMVPQTYVKLSGEQAEKINKLIDKIEEDDDVQEIYHNFELAE